MENQENSNMSGASENQDNGSAVNPWDKESKQYKNLISMLSNLPGDVWRGVKADVAKERREETDTRTEAARKLFALNEKTGFSPGASIVNLQFTEESEFMDGAYLLTNRESKRGRQSVGEDGSPESGGFVKLYLRGESKHIRGKEIILDSRIHGEEILAADRRRAGNEK